MRITIPEPTSETLRRRESPRALVSIIIPTFNAEKTLKTCLKRLLIQNYPQILIEKIVVDSYSKDNTVGIARKLGARVLYTSCGPLGARYLGFKHSNGDFILQLDSDQFLKTEDCLIRAVRLMNRFDMLNFEQFTLPPRTWVQDLYQADMKLMQKISHNLHPLEGMLYPRFFKRKILEQIYQNTPKDILQFTYDHEDVIIHYEALKASNRLGVLKNAVWHLDPSSLREMWRKMYKFGKTGKTVMNTDYETAIKYKKAFRLRELRFLSSAPSDTIKSYLLLLLKFIPYKLGELSPAYHVHEKTYPSNRTFSRAYLSVRP